MVVIQTEQKKIKTREYFKLLKTKATTKTQNIRKTNKGIYKNSVTKTKESLTKKKQLNINTKMKT